MAEYRGLDQIAARLGVAYMTAYRMLTRDGLLAYKVKTGRGALWQWRTNDDLLRVWDLSRCKTSLERLKEEQRVRAENRKMQSLAPQQSKNPAIHEGSESPPAEAEAVNPS